MVKIKDLPKIERPREKLISKGAQNLKDEELLAILLRTGREGKNVLELAKQILKKYSRLVFETQTEYHYGEGTDSLNYKKSHLKETLDECYELEREIRDGVFSQKSEEWKEIFLSLPEGESISFTSVEDGEYFLWYKRISENQFQKLVAGNMSTIGNVYDEGILDFDQVLGSSSGYFLDSILGRRKFEIRKDPLTLRKELSETK